MKVVLRGVGAENLISRRVYILLRAALIPSQVLTNFVSVKVAFAGACRGSSGRARRPAFLGSAHTPYGTVDVIAARFAGVYPSPPPGYALDGCSLARLPQADSDPRPYPFAKSNRVTIIAGYCYNTSFSNYIGSPFSCFLIYIIRMPAVRKAIHKRRCNKGSVREEYGAINRIES